MRLSVLGLLLVPQLLSGCRRCRSCPPPQRGKSAVRDRFPGTLGVLSDGAISITLYSNGESLFWHDTHQGQQYLIGTWTHASTGMRATFHVEVWVPDDGL